MNMDTLIPLIAALPMAGFLFTAVVGRRLGKRAHIVPVAAVGLAWAIAKKIKRVGTKGAFMFTKAFEASQTYIVKVMDAAVDRILNAWSKE